ncbi:MAG: hypothetical protein SYC29_04930 [Planctomycetota bacterium]|nr:hypothetical protein [Planctomycetota bacterium]
MTFQRENGDYTPIMAKKRQADTDAFFARHPVFTLDEAVRTLQSRGGRQGVKERLRHHVETGRLRSIARGIYAVVPTGQSAESFRPDPFLAAQAARPDATFSYHSALELLGAAHSTWSACTAFTGASRLSFRLNGATVRIVPHPTPLRKHDDVELGTQKVERRGRLLRTTGRERTLVEGFRRPNLVGGVSELVTSAGGFGTLDVDLLRKVLKRYGMRRLWAAAGWFLETHAQRFHVTEEELAAFDAHRPRAPQYLVRDSRGGPLVGRWNIVLPPGVTRGDPDGRES